MSLSASRRAASLLIAVLIVTASGSAQVPVDVSGMGGSAVTGFGDGVYVNSFGVVSVAAAPDLPLGVRLTATATYGPGDGGAYSGRTTAFGIGVEAPLSGGRNGVYVALGGAFIDFDNRDRRATQACLDNPNCMDESGALYSYAGLAATVGLGARIPLVRRVWIEPSVSAFVWGDVLPRGQIGVGWRIR